jgi:biopolymer transport protein ExbD
MPRTRPRKKPPKLDMNPMVDMAFLLVTFFMLATSFKTEDPVQITVPAATTEVQLPETGLMTIHVATDGRIFFQIDGKFSKKALLHHVGQLYGLEFDRSATRNFALQSSFGVPIGLLPDFLTLNDRERKSYVQPGIPVDSLQNELTDWVVYARVVNPNIRVAIKADRQTPFQHVDRVMKTLTQNRILRFNLVTDQKRPAHEAF